MRETHKLAAIMANAEKKKSQGKVGDFAEGLARLAETIGCEFAADGVSSKTWDMLEAIINKACKKAEKEKAKAEKVAAKALRKK